MNNLILRDIFKIMKKFLLIFSFLILIDFLLQPTRGYGQETQGIESRRIEYRQLRQNRFGLLPHKPMFLMPLVHNWMPHEDIYNEGKTNEEKEKGDIYRKNEAEFQVSFAVPIVKDIGTRQWDLMFAYTHYAYWQSYNSKWSRPFRETNYMPEIFSRYIYEGPKKFWQFTLYGIDAGYVHQSNGQIQRLSRSWDRIFVRTILEVGSIYTLVTGWYRFEEKSSLPSDNPDIYKYMGHGQLELVKSFNHHAIHFKIPILASHPSYDIKYSYLLNDGIRGLISFQSGYGHSLIEYNKKTQRIGVGFALDNILY